jgi:hypothetical protein
MKYNLNFVHEILHQVSVNFKMVQKNPLCAA